MEKATSGDIKIKWISTSLQIADMFTKPLPQELLLRHARALSMAFQTHTCHICMSEFKSGNTLHSHIRSILMAETPAEVLFKFQEVLFQV